jgi:AraC family transcriptional regulator
MGRVLQHAANHLDEDLDLVALGKIAGLSPRQLERVFGRTMGESLPGHVRRLRLERAAVRLRHSRASILTIALESGFQSHEAFTRAFRQRFGHTPAGYRRLQTTAAPPRARAQLWQLIAASGLRPYVEAQEPPQQSSTNTARKKRLR